MNQSRITQKPVSSDEKKPKEALDIPLFLPVVFWTGFLGIIFERIGTIIETTRTFRNNFGAMLAIIYPSASVLINFSIFSLSILVFYYLIKEFSQETAPTRLTGITAGIFAGFSIILSLTETIFETSLSVFFLTEISAFISCLLLVSTGILRCKQTSHRFFIFLPILLQLLLILHLMLFFSPGGSNRYFQPNMIAFITLSLQLIFLIFIFLITSKAVKFNLQHRYSIIVPALIFLPVVALFSLLISLSDISRRIFFTLLDIHSYMPVSIPIYPIIFGLLTFSIALFLYPDDNKYHFSIWRKRAGISIGLIGLGTFAPQAYYVPLFVLSGTLLWTHTMRNWKDF